MFIFARDYSDVPEVFSRIKSVASSKIVDQVKAIYLFDVAGHILPFFIPHYTVSVRNQNVRISALSALVRLQNVLGFDIRTHFLSFSVARLDHFI